jgi:hypothetical protein
MANRRIVRQNDHVIKGWVSTAEIKAFQPLQTTLSFAASNLPTNGYRCPLGFICDNLDVLLFRRYCSLSQQFNS